MTRWLRRPATWAVLSVWCLANSAQAQIGTYSRPTTNGRPTIPPALNMRGANPVTSYFGVVRPQQETNRALQQLQNDFTMQSSAQNALAEPLAQGQGHPPTSSTGHGASFFNTRQFFSGPNNRFSMGSGGGTGSGGGAGANGQAGRHATAVPIAPGLSNRR